MSEPQSTPPADESVVDSASTAVPDADADLVVVASVETASPPLAPLDLTLLSEEDASDADDAAVVDAPTQEAEPQTTELLLEETLTITVSTEATPDASDDDANMMVAEAATPSFVSFDTLESPSSVLLAVPNAHGGATISTATDAEAVVTEKEAAELKTKKTEEINSDDIIEQAKQGANDSAAEKHEATNDNEEAKENGGDQDAKETTAEAGDKKPKHTNVDDATAKVLES